MTYSKLGFSGHNLYYPPSVPIRWTEGASFDTPATANLKGSLTGPSGVVTLDDVYVDIKILCNFVLDRRDFPTEGNRVRAAPSWSMSGNVLGMTMGTIAAFDHPSVVCTLRARQLRYEGFGGPSGGAIHVDTTFGEQTVLNLKDRFSASETRDLPSTFRFPVMDFDLDRSTNLWIELELTVHIYLEGDASIHFSRFADRPPTNIRIPKLWDLHVIG